MITKECTRGILLAAVAALELSLGGCAQNMHENAVALNAQEPGSVFSGNITVVLDPGNIPHVPASVGKAARWSQEDLDQVAYSDATCQQQLLDLLPGWAQAILKEGGRQALATAVGEGGFAAAFPGVEIARYFLGGGAVGIAQGVNTGIMRQDQSEKGAMAVCNIQLISRWQAVYGILPGVLPVQWTGNGTAQLPPVRKEDANRPLNAPVTPYATVPPAVTHQ